MIRSLSLRTLALAVATLATLGLSADASAFGPVRRAGFGVARVVTPGPVIGPRVVMAPRVVAAPRIVAPRVIAPRVVTPVVTARVVAPIAPRVYVPGPVYSPYVYRSSFYYYGY